jgi:hypothetical protein
MAMRCDGAIVMWSLSEFSYLAAIRNGLQNLYYPEKYWPHARTYAAALKDALYEVCGSKTTLIRPLKSENGVDGFAVIEEERCTGYNNYKAGLIAQVTSDPQILLSPFDDRAEPITTQFNKQLGLVRPASITTSLTAIIGHLGGTPLRPNGCVYWLPEYSIGKWIQVTDVIAGASHNGRNAVHIIRHDLDADAILAVKDAIMAEIQTAVHRIADDLSTGDMGERALDNRQQQARELRGKIAEYEKILSVGLGQLHSAIDDTEVAIGQAALLASTSRQEQVA